MKHPGLALKLLSPVTSALRQPIPRSPARQVGRLLSIPQAADQLSISDKGVRRAINRGNLVAHRIGRLLRIAQDDLAAFMAIRRGGA